MSPLATEYTFVSTIKAKGEQGNSWKMEFDWSLPGSRFPFVLYGRDFEDVEDWTVGDQVEITISQGKLKEGKDGKYSTDYFYDLVSIDSAEAPPPRQTPTKPTPKSTGTIGTKDTPEQPETFQDHVQERIERGMAFNAAYTLLAPTIDYCGGDNAAQAELIRVMRQVRDRLYHEVVKIPVAPAHFCYQHEAQRIENPKSGNWAHQLPDKTWCVEPTGAQAEDTDEETTP